MYPVETAQAPLEFLIQQAQMICDTKSIKKDDSSMNAAKPSSSQVNFLQTLENLRRSLSTPVLEPRDLSGIIKDFGKRSSRNTVSVALDVAVGVAEHGHSWLFSMRM